MAELKKYDEDEKVPDMYYEQLLAVHREEIEEEMNAAHVLYFLPEMGRYAKDIFARERTSRREANGLLLDRVIEMKGSGWFQSFIQALKLAELNQLVNRIENKEISYDVFQKNFLRLFHGELVTEVRVKEVLCILLEDGVIGRLDAINIQETRGHKAVFELLLALPNKKEHWLLHFIIALKKSNHTIVEEICPSLAAATDESIEKKFFKTASINSEDVDEHRLSDRSDEVVNMEIEAGDTREETQVEYHVSVEASGDLFGANLHCPNGSDKLIQKIVGQIPSNTAVCRPMLRASRSSEGVAAVPRHVEEAAVCCPVEEAAVRGPAEDAAVHRPGGDAAVGRPGMRSARSASEDTTIQPSEQTHVKLIVTSTVTNQTVLKQAIVSRDDTESEEMDIVRNVSPTQVPRVQSNTVGNANRHGINLGLNNFLPDIENRSLLYGRNSPSRHSPDNISLHSEDEDEHRGSRTREMEISESSPSRPTHSDNNLGKTQQSRTSHSDCKPVNKMNVGQSSTQETKMLDTKWDFYHENLEATLTRNTIIIRGLPARVTKQEVVEYFSMSGDIMIQMDDNKLPCVWLEIDPSSGNGVARLTYVDESLASMAVEIFNNGDFAGLNLQVGY